MTYDEFKEYLLKHLWKMGDSFVIEALDTIILTAHVELDRVLRELPEREQVATLYATSNTVPLPADLKRIRSLGGALIGDMEYIAPSEFQRKAVQYRNVSSVSSSYFTQVGNNLRLLGNVDAAAPLELELWYEAKIPDFATTDTSWVVDNFFDAYLYCVLKHTAPFLREDERVQVWIGYFTAAMNSILEEGADRKYSGSALKMQFSPNIR